MLNCTPMYGEPRPAYLPALQPTVQSGMPPHGAPTQCLEAERLRPSMPQPGHPTTCYCQGPSST